MLQELQPSVFHYLVLGFVVFLGSSLTVLGFVGEKVSQTQYSLECGLATTVPCQDSC